jgi:hypothetical protein
VLLKNKLKLPKQATKAALKQIKNGKKQKGQTCCCQSSQKSGLIA